MYGTHYMGYAIFSMMQCFVSGAYTIIHVARWRHQGVLNLEDED